MAVLVTACLDPVAALPDAGGGEDAQVDAARDVNAPDAGEEDAAVDAFDAAVDVPPIDGGCGRTWPGRTESDGTDRDGVYVLRAPVFSQADAWDEYGWDLDGVCTAPGETHVCVPFELDDPPSDGVMGADNAFGQAFSAIIEDALPGFGAEIALNMETQPLLILLAEWSGEDNDRSVDFSLVSTNGVVRGDGRTEPQWDGEDLWRRTEDSFVAGDPLIEDLAAYVTDGVLVATIRERQPIFIPWIGGRRVALRLFRGVLTGKISEDRSVMTDVLLQGYIGLSDLRRLFDEAGMCAGSDVRDALDAATNAALDGELRDPATGVCDAVSIAIPFEGVSAGQVGGMFPPPPINTECL